MQLIEIPKYPVLHGEEAVEALNEFIEELKEQGAEELTEKQTEALIKFAQGLISSIEEEHHSKTSDKELRLRREHLKKMKDSILNKLHMWHYQPI